MHGPVRNAIEDVLAAKPFAAAQNTVKHLANCQECASEVDAMRRNAQMLRSLRPSTEEEPSPGFYARVLQRIEEQARRSIWWLFVYSPVGKRVMYASMAITLALGGYVLAAETSDGHLSLTSYNVQSAQAGHFDAPVMGTEDEQRTAVLENFAAHPVSFKK